MPGTGYLELEGIASRYGDTPVLADIDLSIARGEFVALLGASGCGKTTLLKLMAGFVAPSAGRLLLGGRDVTHLPPDRRGMALVFQSYALWPHMNVDQTIGYGLKLKGTSRAEIAARVTAIKVMLGLEALGERKPSALSGGQRQRVALGRALAVDPEILLLDEPLSNLDARIRLTVRHELRALQKRLGITAVHVTHDREEAMVMADRIVILDGGRIAQAGAPEAVYNHPATSFVAAFMGAENLLSLHGRPAGDEYLIDAGPLNAAGAVPLAGRSLAAGPVEARFRSEAARLFAQGEAEPQGPGVTFAGEVVSAGYPGGHWRHVVLLGEAEVLADAPTGFAPGSRVGLHVPAAALFLFNPPAERPATPLSRHEAGKARAASAGAD